MSWPLSRFRAGDIVEIRSKEEILATLDRTGCVEGLPFMPEMLKFCGQRVSVRAVAHKTCETALKTYQGRRLQSAVHLDNLRCDGAAHGDCQADCTLFWKDIWLKPVSGTMPAKGAVASSDTSAPDWDEERLIAASKSQQSVDGKDYYVCQATKLYDATKPLAWWDLRQYAYDVITGNHTLGRVFRVTWLGSLRAIVRFADSNRYVWHLKPVRWIARSFSEWMHRLLMGRGMPTLFNTMSPLQRTPTGRLGLKPGELIRIKQKQEIEKTLDRSGKNRGLSFDPAEMAPYCGGTYRVRRSVTTLLDEATGERLEMKEPCIILEDVVCKSEVSNCRLNCPREFYAFWRELWLERVDEARD